MCVILIALKTWGKWNWLAAEIPQLYIFLFLLPLLLCARTVSFYPPFLCLSSFSFSIPLRPLFSNSSTPLLLTPSPSTSEVPFLLLISSPTTTSPFPLLNPFFAVYLSQPFFSHEKSELWINCAQQKLTTQKGKIFLHFSMSSIAWDKIVCQYIIDMGTKSNQ